jgi:sugar-phosphatase
VKGAAAPGFDARTCLLFEDAPSGICAAKAAGTSVVGIPRTYPREELSDADTIVPPVAAVSASVDQQHERPTRIDIAAD